MVEVFNMEGMPVYKFRTNEDDTFAILSLEGKASLRNLFCTDKKSPWH